MDRSWIDLPDKLSEEYANGITDFISMAKKFIDSKGLVLCPCCRCVNKQSQKINVIKFHLVTYGFLSTYKKWCYHGEKIDQMKEKIIFNTQDEDEDIKGEQDDLAAGLNDAFNNKYFDIGPTTDFADDSPFNVDDKYDSLLISLHMPLYDNCKEFYVLSVVVRLMNVKVLNKLTDKAFNDMLKCFKAMLPEGNNFPEDYYQTRKLLCDVGLGYEQIDVCQFDCALFYGENANALLCPICKSSRYVRNKIPHKRLRWFPLKARLKRLFSYKFTSKDMRWHKDVRKEEIGVLRHPADGMAWKHFDNTYPDFAKDSRSVQMGLASDGFNPFSNLSSTYSLWPVILIPYNMPPWASPNGTNYLMSLLIPGPRSHGKDYDVFLQPLIDELKELWDGVDAYDSYGHRCYLNVNHPWRRSKEYDGSTELRGPPRNFTGEDILKQLEEVPTRTTGKAPSNSSRKRKRGAKELNWCKRSILFDLPYWSKLLLQHNLDVMHIEKNVCDNIIGTLLDIEGKSKDNLKARKDLEDLNIREEL
ncbi:uncharacterized protein LOC141705880 isoform X2 [Apium graveolens]|uniref:uncharacterized protein LOC141705880 isoform X2 n=1 Tax=Apium graveolens TaxID=4045 RepID=UPI003D79D00B